MSRPEPGRAVKSRHQDQRCWALGPGKGWLLKCRVPHCPGSSGKSVKDLLFAGYFYLQPRGFVTSYSSPEKLLISDGRG